MGHIRRKSSAARWRLSGLALVGCGALIFGAYALGLPVAMGEGPKLKLRPVERPLQPPRAGAPLHVQLVQATRFIRAKEARDDYQVSGKGLTAAIVDTGLRTSHVDFTGRVADQSNFTADNGGITTDAADGNGHGTNVAGIVAAAGIHTGIAPGARLVPLKALANDGNGNFEDIERALEWVLDNQAKYDITAVNLSLGDTGNYTSDGEFANNPLHKPIADLRAKRVAVVISAGNGYFAARSKQGMSFPAILRESLSVGAVYDSIGSGYYYPADGAQSNRTAPDQITPFSQRLSRTLSKECATDIFAPGAPITSSGIRDDTDFSIDQGTSQAAPVIAGVVLLLQEYWRREAGELPTVDNLEKWLRDGAVKITDEAGTPPCDNVEHTKEVFVRVDALGALQAAHRQLQDDVIRKEAPQWLPPQDR